MENIERAGSTEKGSSSPFPAAVLCGFLSFSTVILWSELTCHLFSYCWHAGSLEPFLYALRFACILGAVLVFLYRRRINARYSEVFTSVRGTLVLIAVFILVTTFWVGTTEIVFRFLGVPFPEKEEAPETAIGRFDPELGWAYREGTSFTMVVGSDSRKIPIHFDDLGSRVSLPGMKRDAEKPTALFVGGSFTMGHGVVYEESFPGILDVDENFPYQTVNLGVQGYGTDQSLITLKRFFDRFNTKVVVYTFICDHIRRNSQSDRRLFHPSQAYRGTKPTFVIGPDGELVLNHRPAIYEEKPYFHVGATLKVLHVNFGPPPEFDVTRALVGEMQDYTESRGGRFLLLYWKPWKDKLCESDPFAEMEIEILKTEEHEPLEWNSWVVSGDNHPDFRAHRHVARLLADRLDGRNAAGVVEAGNSN